MYRIADREHAAPDFSKLDCAAMHRRVAMLIRTGLSEGTVADLTGLAVNDIRRVMGERAERRAPHQHQTSTVPAPGGTVLGGQMTGPPDDAPTLANPLDTARGVASLRRNESINNGHE